MFLISHPGGCKPLGALAGPARSLHSGPLRGIDRSPGQVGDSATEGMKPMMPRSPVSLALVALWGLLAGGCGTTSSSPAVPPQDGAVPPLAAAGRWLVDAEGRVVLLHGMNEVAKQAPFSPDAFGFGEDDVAFLGREGFTALRLGVDMRGMMPEPGRIDPGYMERLATTVESCRRHGLFVLLDFHQDGFAPKYRGNGFPDWMGLDDGLPNPPADFPLYYVLNPAMQRAFEHFWADDPIPGGDGRGGASYVLQAMEAVLGRFGADTMVLGAEIINEPWPGADWQDCAYDRANGCPGVEQSKLMPFYRRGLEISRRTAPDRLLFVEPFVLFNFGQAPTTIPGPDPGFGLSFHSYALEVAGEEAVVRFGREAAERDGAPALVTEFGATADLVLVERLLDQFDGQLLPWMWWAYGERIVADRDEPLTEESITNPDLLRSLLRPHAQVTAGVPTRISFDHGSRVFEYEYSTVRAGGGGFREGADTVVLASPRVYPNGYSVEVEGATVVSEPCASRLRLRTDGAVGAVRLRIVPGGAC